MWVPSERSRGVPACFFAVIALVTPAHGAWCDEAESDPPAKLAAPYLPTPAGGQPLVTVHVFDEEISGKVVSEVLGAFAEVLAKDSLVRYRDLADLLDPVDEATAAIAEADGQLKEAQAAFDQMDLENARNKAESAIRIYERRLPQLGAEPDGISHLRNAWIRLAAIRFFDGNNDGARDALRHVFVLDPTTEYSGKLFPPQMKKAVVESRLLFDALGSGKLNVQSEPPGAMVIINGVVRGISPLVIDDAPAGPDYVSLARRGFVPLTAVVEVNGAGDEAKAEQTLTRFDNDPIGPLGSARAELGRETAPPSVVESANKLRVDLLALVTLGSDGAVTRVTAYLYDQRSRRLLRKSEASGEPAEAGRKAAVDLFNQVRLDGVYVPPAPVKVKSGWERFTDRFDGAAHEWRASKAFWPSVIVAAVVVAAGVGIGLGIGLRPHESAAGPTPGEELILLGTGR